MFERVAVATGDNSRGDGDASLALGEYGRVHLFA